MWTLTGGGLDFGEHPQVGAIRELAEETGYVGELDALIGIDAHFVQVDGVEWHNVRIMYRAHVVGGALAYETDGSTDLAAWIPAGELDDLDAVPLVAAGRLALARPGLPVASVVPTPVPPSALPRASRFAAYAVVRDDDDRVLLTHAGPGTTWAGRWILPGGGAELGEELATTVIREVVEETGLDVAVDGLLAVTSDVVDSIPRQEQVWTVRVVCDAQVVGGTLRAEVDGSTDEARWFSQQELETADLVPFVHEVLLG